MRTLSNQNDIVNLIQRGRIEFLERSIKKSADRREYSKIIQYFSSPTIQLAVQDRVKIDDYSLVDVQGLSNEDLRKNLITALYNYYREDPKNFEKFFSDGQYIIWQTVFSCAENLVNIKDEIESIEYSAKKSNYPNSCEVVKEYLSCLAEAYRQITLLEKKLGIDRYLATSGLTKDIRILHDLVGEIRYFCNKKLEKTVVDFQLNWNLTSISKSIEKMLGKEIQDNSITNSISPDQEIVIFLLLDGFGYTQYLWYLRGIKERKSTTFSLNIFEWLSEFNEFNDNRILSSTLITDTGSALATIFSGKQPSETHIYASKILHRNKTINVKKATGNGFSSLVDKYPNTFLDRLAGVQIIIFDGGRKKSSYGEVSFSGLIYSDNTKIPIPISDRIFKKILTSIDTFKKQLNIAYFPLIDNTGHSIGAFTSFESYEYEKLNILFVEFLLNLAQTKEEIFNGKTTILISADHGMFETSIKKFTMNELKSYLSGENLPIPLYTNNSRAVLFYHIADVNLETYRNVIQEFLKNKKIEAKILISTDELFSKLFTSKNPDCPSLILLVQGDGFAMDFELEEEQLHHGGHGGCSCEEVFVPFITLTLTPNLHHHLIEHFAKLS
jgi:hypothetical protein